MTYQDLYDEQHEMHKPDYVKMVIVILLFSVVVFFIFSREKKPIEVDSRTKELCAQYAKLNHEKELAPSRYKWLGKEFVDNFDWYQSCINHNLYPVAK